MFTSGQEELAAIHMQRITRGGGWRIRQKKNKAAVQIQRVARSTVLFCVLRVLVRDMTDVGIPPPTTRLALLCTRGKGAREICNFLK